MSHLDCSIQSLGPPPVAVSNEIQLRRQHGVVVALAPASLEFALQPEALSDTPPLPAPDFLGT